LTSESDPVTDPAPCGSWPSPLSPEEVARAAVRLQSPTVAAGGSLFWLEGRPGEGGRTVLVERRADGSVIDVTPPPFNVRSRVHEYGGGAFALAGPDNEVFFVHFADQAVYRQRPGATPVRLTAVPSEGDPTAATWRFGDLVADPARPRLLAVGERHDPRGHEPENAVVSIERTSGAIEVLIRGADFYASPTPNAEGTRLAWLSWSHPHMPWDAAALQVADLDPAGRPGQARHLAGDEHGSAQQPAFGPDGALWFLYEGSGFWNLWREGAEGIEPLFEIDGEIGLPLWQLGVSTWGMLDERTVLVAVVRQGIAELHTWDTQLGRLRPVPLELTSVMHLATRPGRAAVLAGFSDRPPAILEVGATGESLLVRQAFTSFLEPGFVSRPEPIAFPTSAGDTAFGFFYPPQNPRARPLDGEKPPLLLLVHGGPTAACAPALSVGVQFWTTRGFAVLDLNYRGSTGYGRRYRDRLKGNWGVYDVDDCIAGARTLCEAGRVDPARLAIRGGSAGGYTVLATLVSSDRFRAGASHYGVSDLSTLVRDTHKFESRYCESLIAPIAEQPELYAQRSPITQAAELRSPVIFFQGLDDKVVPPEQTERLVQALRDRGQPVEYHAFEGEQHGFRRADTIRRVLETELAFYGRVFGFDPS
jgi:dipeptidyl aminopeptidase/acylaminoacyl peptidase